MQVGGLQAAPSEAEKSSAAYKQLVTKGLIDGLTTVDQAIAAMQAARGAALQLTTKRQQDIAQSMADVQAKLDKSQELVSAAVSLSEQTGKALIVENVKAWQQCKKLNILVSSWQVIRHIELARTCLLIVKYK